MSLRNFDELFKFINENGVELTFDTSHCACGDFPIVETFNRFKGFIRNIHISDFKDCNEHKVLGAGNLPLKDFILNLKRENYNGLLTIELDFDNKKRNDIKSNEEAVAAIQKSIDLIESSINKSK